ncbi:MAG: glycosyltransferase family 2 protein [Spirochaetaceae bacterium]|nr:glycosyltransferase family 2 protein [Spirochaetaceae bacterium]MBP5328973.1 glycosyltransferase family 2 protein [Spirochaetaceae bacterium]
MKTLIIIPAFNESENIERVVNNLITNYPRYEYIIINDGSADSTAAVCRKNGYNFIDLPVNLGLAGAFQTGMKFAWTHGYDAALQFDGDGQHRPEYIQSMIEKMEAEKADIVIGSRFVTQKKSLSPRMFGSRLISLLILLTTGKKIKDPTSGMRLYSRKVMEEFANGLNYGPEPDTIAYLLNKGCSVKEVQVTMDERIAGKSYLNAVSSIYYMMRICISIVFVQWFRKR